MRRWMAYLGLLGGLSLAGCAVPQDPPVKAEVVLPLQRAWADGGQVEYVSTDISDAAMAALNGMNYVPRLADALPVDGRKSLVERVYKFPQGEQISVFQSAPTPAGAANTDKSYSPLWRLVMVTWLKPDKVRELKSEEDVFSAEDRGEVSLRITNIVANCPVVRSADGRAIAGAR